MTELTFTTLFTQFLYRYWGAFHEALEAQSVTPGRLAGSLFNALQAEHRSFEDMYAGRAKSALDRLGHIWQELEVRGYQSPDPAFTRDQVSRARHLFETIHASLVREGREFPAARMAILAHAPHATPSEPLRADAAR